MSNPKMPRTLLLRAAFQLIKLQSTIQSNRKHSTINLVQTLHRIHLCRLKRTFNSFKSVGLTSRMGYEPTQSVLRLFYFLEQKIYRNKKESFGHLSNFAKIKNISSQIDQASYLPWQNENKSQQNIQALKDKKLIAAMKILNLFRKLTLFDWKTMKPFRKWQLEDLRNLVNGYERNNCILYLTLRNLSVVSIVKALDSARKKMLENSLYEIQYYIHQKQEFDALKLKKLGNILMKKKIINDTMTLNLSIIVTFKKFFKNLSEIKAIEEQKEISTMHALNTICLSWKQNLSHNFRSFSLKCLKESRMQKEILHHQSPKKEINSKNPDRLLKSHSAKFLARFLDFIYHKKMRVNFKILSNARLGENLKAKKQALIRFGALNRLSNLKSDQDQSQFLLIAFSKLKQNSKNNAPVCSPHDDLKNDAVAPLVQTLKFLMKKQLKAGFQKIKAHSKAQQAIIINTATPKPLPKKKIDLMFEQNIIQNQALIAQYFERRMNEIDVSLLNQKKTVLLKKILIRKTMDVYDIKRERFRGWKNLILHWKLSAKLRVLKYKDDLELEINQLSLRYNQLMNEPNLFERQEQGMDYLEFHENQNTELRQKYMLLQEIMRIRNKRTMVYSP